MIDNIIYGLGTISFVILAVFVFGFVGLVVTGISLGMIDSAKRLFESKKGAE